MWSHAHAVAFGARPDAIEVADFISDNFTNRAIPELGEVTTLAIHTELHACSLQRFFHANDVRRHDGERLLDDGCLDPGVCCALNFPNAVTRRSADVNDVRFDFSEGGFEVVVGSIYVELGLEFFAPIFQ